MTLKAKYADFRQVTRSRTCEAPIASTDDRGDRVALLEPLFPAGKGIRLLGVTLSSFNGGAPTVAHQLDLSLPGSFGRGQGRHD